MSGSEFYLRETEDVDAAALNDLYCRLTAIARSEAQWRWEWREGPWGVAPSWVVIEAASGKVVGHHGVVPQHLLLPSGQVVTACRTENTMVDPDFRKRFLYVAYEARLLKIILERFDVVVTPAGKGPQAALRKRLGYHAVGVWRTAPLHTHPLYRVATVLPHNAFGWLPARRTGGDWQIENTNDLARVVALCGRAVVTAITIERSEAFLRWRFLAHPYHSYQLAIMRRNGSDEGYIAWKRVPRGGTVDLVVEDLLMISGSAGDYRQALRAFAMAQSGAVRLVLRTLAAGGPLHAVMAEAAPAVFAAPNPTELLVRWRNAPPAFGWDMTPALSQGI